VGVDYLSGGWVSRGGGGRTLSSRARGQQRASESMRSP
jgi:hypothetical protein